MKPFAPVLIGLGLALASIPAGAWGPTGHRVVAEIASQRLDSKARKEAAGLLEGRSLAQVSNWADFVKSNAPWEKSGPWHYVNVPKGKGYLESPRSPQGDLIRSILHFEERLRDSKLAVAQRADALKFVVHFMGDLSMPLHLGYADDRGGNGIDIDWFGKKSNLHRLWDEHLIEHEQLSFTEYAAFLGPIRESAAKATAGGGLLDWMEEGRARLDGIYSGAGGEHWEWDYRYRHLEDLNSCLLRGGIRLAAVLNAALGKGPEIPGWAELRKKLRPLMPE